MREIVDAAADLLLGGACPGCLQPGWSLCQACRQWLTDQEPHAVARPGWVIPAVAAGDYRPLLERVIPAYKDDGAWHLGRMLAERLAVAVQALAPPPDSVLVPVPSLPAAVRRRGLDHGARLAAHAAKRLGLRWVRLLRRSRNNLDQRELGRAGRLANMNGAFEPRGRSPIWLGLPVVVCDDVVTTGASIAQAVLALQAAGHQVVGAAVIADADRRRGTKKVTWARTVPLTG